MLYACHIGAISYCPTFPFTLQETCLSENGQIGRHGVLANIQLIGDITSQQSLVTSLDQQAENLQTG